MFAFGSVVFLKDRKQYQETQTETQNCKMTSWWIYFFGLISLKYLMIT